MSYQFAQEDSGGGRVLGGRVLWGRVAFLGAGLVLAFLLGRVTASEGVPAAQVQQRDKRIQQLADEAEGLRRQVQALEAGAPAQTGGAAAQEAGTDSAIADAGEAARDRPERTEPNDKAADDARQDEAPAQTEKQEQAKTSAQEQAPPPSPTGTANSETYQVQTDDTLYTIAERVYGDGLQWTRIAEANNLDGERPLNVGQDLQIPRG
jgi:nucleoid-associated protein YgaU